MNRINIYCFSCAEAREWPTGLDLPTKRTACQVCGRVEVCYDATGYSDRDKVVDPTKAGDYDETAVAPPVPSVNVAYSGTDDGYNITIVMAVGDASARHTEYSHLPDPLVSGSPDFSPEGIRKVRDRAIAKCAQALAILADG